MTADEILKKHEDENEMHFHQCDREFIIQAMIEYSKQPAEVLCEHPFEKVISLGKMHNCTVCGKNI